MKLKKSILIPNQTVKITGSKSISNRLLILEKLFGNILIENLSNSEDTAVLQNALSTDQELVDIHHAGTAMRFLTSYFALQEGKSTLLTGSARMKQRPIKPLVDALKTLGADIEYLEDEGFPPLKIYGKKLSKSRLEIPANISSQFISSLLLIGAKLENGLQLKLLGEITSKPYLALTLKILKNMGIQVEWTGHTIKILPYKRKALLAPSIFQVESDWSSASYFYSLAAIGRENIALTSFFNHSHQGDSILKTIYWDYFGVNTISDMGAYKIALIPEKGFEYPELIRLNMNDCPDIAQTVCVTATILKIPFHLDGLHTLKIKETDRLKALKNELAKIGCHAEITDDAIISVDFYEPKDEISISTYNDHRMAMSFAPFCLIRDLEIQDENVVEKSYPGFWADLHQVLHIKEKES